MAVVGWGPGRWAQGWVGPAAAWGLRTQMPQTTAGLRILPEIFLAFSTAGVYDGPDPRLKGAADLTTLPAMTGQTQTVTEHSRAAVGEVQRAWGELLASLRGA